jgi:transcriptional antiterminator RfaH
MHRDNHPGEEPAWFCVRSHPKHEHIAAAHLRQAGIEVLLPRIRFRKASLRGPVWTTEVLFPCYLFARFDWRASLRLVHHSPGVSKVVSFGTHWPAIPDGIIDELREAVGADELHVIDENFSPGDKVKISGGIFHGLTALVMQVIPARQRVRVLLDFLGRQTMVEVSGEKLVKEELPHKRLGRSAKSGIRPERKE